MKPKQYRVWAAGEMHYPSIITFDASGASFAPESGGGGSFRVPLADAMQFTGVTDVNGVGVYEGDVVKGQRYLDRPGQFARFIGAVEYDAWWGAYRRKGVKQYQGLDADLRHGRELEVIGNIYSNPELLERP